MTERPAGSETRRTVRWLYAFFAFILLSASVSAWMLFHPDVMEPIVTGGNVVYFDPLTWLSTP